MISAPDIFSLFFFRNFPWKKRVIKNLFLEQNKKLNEDLLLAIRQRIHRLWREHNAIRNRIKNQLCQCNLNEPTEYSSVWWNCACDDSTCPSMLWWLSCLLHSEYSFHIACPNWQHTIKINTTVASTADITVITTSTIAYPPASQRQSIHTLALYVWELSWCKTTSLTFR